MKNPNKLQINSEKIIKNDELVNLRGGYDNGYCCECYNSCCGIVGYAYSANSESCFFDCQGLFSGSYGI